MVTPTRLPEVFLIEPTRIADQRGSFCELYTANGYRALGIHAPFVQDNVSVSRRGVLRGLHLQNPRSQGKLITVVYGEIFDVAVDVRRDSDTFGAWVGERLSAANGRQLYVPPGFAHGFLALADDTTFLYKCTDYYDRASEISIRWNDPDIGIEWPMSDVILSERDRDAPTLASIPRDRLPLR